LVIDTAVSFVPLADRNKRTLRWSLSQLTMIADTPAAVWILNQSRNLDRPLAAFADIVIKMEVPRGRGPTRRRTFTGVGRYPDTLQTAAGELNLAGTDYVPLPDSPPVSPPLLATLQALLTESDTPLTRRDLLARWPGVAPRPDTVWRTLVRGVEVGLFVVSGTGTKADAFRYGLVRRTKPMEPPDSNEPPAPPG
jgi:hypothetical protein